ncbi:MAG: protein kinase [Alphaproteobacteria bacterium]|nr:protein kinase [Alphaproteobacteria bacterium]
MNPDNVQALPTGTSLGDFRLDAMIGHGSFGITYRAFDTQLAKIVAIKEYLPVEFAVRKDTTEVVSRGSRFADDFTWGRERFLDEARALARFRHPHIVPVLRYFELNGTAYTVMEFEDGRSVAELLREPGRRLPADDVRRLADGLLSGLAAVHAQGFLHRDIKPSNIIVRRDGVPILIDFGAARQAIGGRTRTLTGVLTPQYAPIEQYALDGKQGPWSDIYSAAAVLHHAIVGRSPPEAASRVGSDPYRPLAKSDIEGLDAAFLAAVDRGLGFAANERPQSVAEWRGLFGASLPSAQDAPTQRMASPAAPRLGGVNREYDERLMPPRAVRSRSGFWPAIVVVLLLGAAAAWWFEPMLRDKFTSSTQEKVQGASQESSSAPTASDNTASADTQQNAPSQPNPSQPNTGPNDPTALVPPPTTPATPPPNPATPPQPTPLKPSTNAATPAPSSGTSDTIAEKALIGQAEHAAAQARAAADKAKEAANAARATSGEARIAAARAAQPSLENADRLSYPNGASYVGQISAGQRQGLGVADLDNDQHLAGEWKDDRLDGLGTAKFSDGTRYEGRWRDGQPTGLGVREKPGVERAAGNFVDNRLEGAGVRRQMTDPGLVQAGEFHADALDGVGVETFSGSERYEGEFRAGQRSGYGLLFGADGKGHAGRWENGKQVETAR